MRLRLMLMVAFASVATGCATLPQSGNGPATAGTSSSTSAKPATQTPSTQDQAAGTDTATVKTQPLTDHTATTAVAAQPLPPSHPAGAEVWANPVPLIYAPDAPELYARIRAGFGIPDLTSPLVKTHEDWYRARPEYVQRMLARSQRYLYYIETQVERRGMPTEIALLPMVESAFNPKAYSRSNASGIWQFVPSTGRDYGLEQSHWVDKRRDIISATNAALDYLDKLYNIFGDWDLALAAYNCGEGYLARTITRQAALGLPTDYQSLPLPAETRNYVPKLMAIKHLISNPQDFGINLAAIPNKPYFVKVEINQHLTVAEAAHLAGISEEEFLALNPAPNHSMILEGQLHRVLLPVENASAFEENLAHYKSPYKDWHIYTAHRGDKITTIAHRTGVPAAKIAAINDLPHLKGKLHPGAQLLVPPAHTQLAEAEERHDKVNQEAAADEVAKSDAPADSSDATEATATPAETGRKPVAVAAYEVKRGDTLFNIAKRHNVSPHDLMHWNNLESSAIRLGQVLKIELKRAIEPQEAVAATMHDEPVVHKQYTVRRGDTLYSIARRFQVAVADLLKWNPWTKKHALRPGAKVKLRLAEN